jgi:hypothetical protein
LSFTGQFTEQEFRNEWFTNALANNDVKKNVGHLNLKTDAALAAQIYHCLLSESQTLPALELGASNFQIGTTGPAKLYSFKNQTWARIVRISPGNEPSKTRNNIDSRQSPSQFTIRRAASNPTLSFRQLDHTQFTLKSVVAVVRAT